MTREEILNTPEIVDFMLDKSVIAESKMKLHKRLDELCKLAIKALEQEPCEDADSRQAVKEQMIYYGFLAPDMTVTEFVEDCLPSVNTQKPFINKPCVSSGVCEHDKTNVLDKIRAEIIELTKCPYGTKCLGANCPSNTDCMICGDHVLEIIDKYKAESEG